VKEQIGETVVVVPTQPQPLGGQCGGIVVVVGGLPWQAHDTETLSMVVGQGRSTAELHVSRGQFMMPEPYMVEEAGHPEAEVVVVKPEAAKLVEAKAKLRTKYFILILAFE